MSTSLLYHTQGISVFQHVNLRYVGGAVQWTVRRPAWSFRCPSCGSRHVRRRPSKRREILGLPTGSRQNVIVVQIHRLRCDDCGTDRQESIPFADSKKSFTKRLARYVIELRRHMSVKAIAEHLGMHWGTVKAIEKEHLRKKFKRIPLRKVKALGIDEIHVGKKLYLTVVLNLQTGEVLHVGPGKDGDSLKPFLRRLRAARAKIQVVAMDMSKAYTAWVRDKLPGARIVYDRFHVTKLMNERLDDLRRQLQNDLPAADKRVLKGKRWLLLRGQERLSDDRRADLEELLAINRPLAIAYQLKEKLRCLWREPDREEAEKALNEWCLQASSSDIPQLKAMAKTLRNHWEGVLAYFDEGRISSAPVEGFNNKIRWLIRQAYGFRDQEYFMLKIYDLPERKVRLV